MPVSRLVLNDRRLSPTAKYLYVTLDSFAITANKVWPSQHRLALQTNLSERTVRHALGELRAVGLITIERTKSTPPRNIYWLENLDSVYPSAVIQWESCIRSTKELEKLLNYTRRRRIRDEESTTNSNEQPLSESDVSPEDPEGVEVDIEEFDPDDYDPATVPTSETDDDLDEVRKFFGDPKRHPSSGLGQETPPKSLRRQNRNPSSGMNGNPSSDMHRQDLPWKEEEPRSEMKEEYTSASVGLRPPTHTFTPLVPAREEPPEEKPKKRYKSRLAEVEEAATGPGTLAARHTQREGSSALAKDPRSDFVRTWENGLESHGQLTAAVEPSRDASDDVKNSEVYAIWQHEVVERYGKEGESIARVPYRALGKKLHQCIASFAAKYGQFAQQGDADVLTKTIRVAVWDWFAARELKAFSWVATTDIPTLREIHLLADALQPMLATGLVSPNHRSSKYYQRYVRKPDVSGRRDVLDEVAAREGKSRAAVYREIQAGRIIEGWSE